MVSPSLAAGHGAVLLITHSLQPVDDLPVELFLNRDVRHRRAWRGAVPVLLARWAPDDIAGANDADRAAPALHETAACGDDQRLTQRMCVPVAARAGLERHVGAACPCGLRCFKEGINTYRASEVLGRTLSGGLRAVSFQFHVQCLLSGRG